MVPSNYINYHRLAHNYTKRPSRPRLRRTGYWPADAGGDVWPILQKERRSITPCHFLAAPDMLYFSESMSKSASSDIWVDIAAI